MATEAQRINGSPDQGIVARARAGERAAFDQLFTLHKDGVYACLWHLLDGDGDLIEEAVGNVFLSAFRGLHRFRGDASFRTWLFRIAVNEAHARKRQKKRWHLLDLLSIHEPAAARESTPRDDDPADRVVRSEEEKALWRAVRALPEPYRTPLGLRYMS